MLGRKPATTLETALSHAELAAEAERRLAKPLPAAMREQASELSLLAANAHATLALYKLLLEQGWGQNDRTPGP